MKFFARMFTQFFARARPDSTIAKPRFMKKTSMPAIKTQTVSSAILLLASCSAMAAVNATGASAASSAWPRCASTSVPSTAPAIVGHRRGFVISVDLFIVLVLRCYRRAAWLSRGAGELLRPVFDLGVAAACETRRRRVGFVEDARPTSERGVQRTGAHCSHKGAMRVPIRPRAASPRAHGEPRPKPAARACFLSRSAGFGGSRLGTRAARKGGEGEDPSSGSGHTVSAHAQLFRTTRRSSVAVATS